MRKNIPRTIFFLNSAASVTSVAFSGKYYFWFEKYYCYSLGVLFFLWAKVGISAC